MHLLHITGGFSSYLASPIIQWYVYLPIIGSLCYLLYVLVFHKLKNRSGYVNSVYIGLKSA